MPNNDLYVTSALVNKLTEAAQTPIPDTIIDPQHLGITDPFIHGHYGDHMERYCEIWIKFQMEGIHKYPAALTDPNLADVQFLGYPFILFSPFNKFFILGFYLNFGFLHLRKCAFNFRIYSFVF